MEQTCLVTVSASVVTYVRATGPIPDLVDGLTLPRGECLLARMLDGAPTAATRLDQASALSDTAEHTRFGIRSYVAMPVVGQDGSVLAILAGLDRSEVTVPADVVTLLRAVADGLGAVGTSQVAGQAESRPAPPGGGPPRPGPPPGGPGRAPTPETVARAMKGGPPGRGAPPRPGPPKPGPPKPGPPRGAAAPGGTPPGAAPPGAAPPGAAPPGAAGRRPGGEMRLRRTPAGWIVEGPGAEVRPVGDLISAMVLADLLAEDLTPPGRPRRPDRDLSEIEQLRLSVVQLEHALASRVIVEQAIGVLAERNHIRPREAFERLRRTARGMGRRVHDLARQVVDSVDDPRVTLPGELGGRGGGGGPGAGTGTGTSGSSGSGGGGMPRPAPPRATPSRR